MFLKPSELGHPTGDLSKIRGEVLLTYNFGLKSKEAKMKLKFLIFAALSLTLLSINPGWAQCPEDTCDRGVCDTFYVQVFAEDSIFDPPYDSVRVAMYITHDQSDWIDSLGTIVVPLRFTITNTASGCSLPTPYDNNWNNTTTNPNDARMPRSLFRHLVDPVTGDTIHNRMQDLASQFAGLEWSYRILFIENDPSHPDSSRVGRG